jgi:hypothetical protein
MKTQTELQFFRQLLFLGSNIIVTLSESIREHVANEQINHLAHKNDILYSFVVWTLNYSEVSKRRDHLSFGIRDQRVEGNKRNFMDHVKRRRNYNPYR